MKNTIYSVAIADHDFEEINLIAAFTTKGKLLQFICDYAKEVGATIKWDTFTEKFVILCPNDDLEQAFVLTWEHVPLI